MLTCTFNYTYTNGIGAFYIDSGNILTQSGTTVMICGDEYLGDEGEGVYTQSGGTNSVTSALYLGVSSGSSNEGLYLLSGGTLKTTSSSPEFIGYNGSGEVIQSGGSNSLSGSLILGVNTGSVGTYELDASSASLSANVEAIGSSGSGELDEFGGSNQTNNLQIGTGSASGTYLLDGGSLDGGVVTVGANGTFEQFTGSFTFTSFSQTGGSVTFSSGLTVGTGQTYTQTGGTLTFPTLNQTGGSVSLTGLNLTTATYNLSGGSLTTPSITTSGSPPAKLNWTGGSLTLTSQPFDVTTTTDPTYGGFVYNSALTLTSGMALDVTGTLSGGNLPWIALFGNGASVTQNANSTVNTPYFYMGSSGTGAAAAEYNLTGGFLNVLDDGYIGANLYTGANAATFTQSDGIAFFGSLYIGYFGTGPDLYTLSSGTMSVTAAINLGSGTFHQSGGKLLFQTFDQSGGVSQFDTGLTLTTSTATLSAGSMSVTSITSNATGPANLAWSGGSLTLTKQSFDVTTTTDPNFGGLVYNSSLTLSSGMSLTVNGSNSGEFVFGSGSTITQNTGSTNSATVLFMGSSGTSATPVQYSLTGGSLTVTEAIVGHTLYPGAGAATFSQSGGTSSFGDFILGLDGTGPDNVTLSSSSMSVTAALSIDAGTFHQTGGTLTSAGTTNNSTFSQTGGTSALGALSGTGTVALGGGASSTTMTVTNFTQGSINISSNGQFIVQHNSNFANTVSSLTISGSGGLDLVNNHMFISYGSSSDPITTIRGYLLSGYNNGKWNGPGIIASAAQVLTNGLRYGVGWADGADGAVTGLSSGTIELKYTLLGDANLDGTVNGSDFSILAANFGLGTTNWDQGNFLYGSSVNGSDFSALAANFGQGDSGAEVSVTQADVDALDSFAVANGLPLPVIGAVPEPAAVGMIVLAAMGVVSRRRRSSR